MNKLVSVLPAGRWTIALLAVVALVGCRRSPAPTPTPLATTPSSGSGARSTGDTVSASGEIAPAQEVRLSFTLPGQVQAVAVARGDAVQAGQDLVALGTSILEIGVSQAKAALAAARAQLARLEAGPRPEESAAAQAQLEAAQAALVQATAQLDQQDVGATEAEVAAAQARVAAAQADRLTAAEIHDQTMTCLRVKLPGSEEKEKICPALGTIEEQARYNLEAADGALAAAQARLDALLNGAGAEKRAAQAGVQAAAARAAAAQAQLDLLQEGATAEEIAVAEVRVAQAQAAVDAARAMLDQATLRAPCAGTVVALEVSPGEMVLPGQIVLTLADLGSLQVKTTDLSEQDVARVAVGQKAAVYVEPLNTEVAGRVTRIGLRATEIGGDVVYEVTVELGEQLEGLRWGMSVEVEIAAPAISTPMAQALAEVGTGGTVVASGEVAPAQEAELSLATSGRVWAVAVAESDTVRSGDTLVTLDAALLEADVAQAETGVTLARAQLALLKAGPRPGAVAAAKAQVEAAQAAWAQASAQGDQLTAGATDVQITDAQAQLATAQAAEWTARAAYDSKVKDQQVEEWVKQAAFLQLRAATQDRVAAEARLAQTKEGVAAQVRAAQAAVEIAAAQRDAAQAQFDLAQAGATAEEIAVAEVGVAEAETALDAARAALDQATLRAPTAGTVAALEINPGETALQDQAVLTLADLSHLRVQTTDLSERDVAKVAVGQPATVRVEPLGVSLAGRVVEIASQATAIGGDVVYAVVIELDEQPVGLRWGMSAEVEIAAE